MSRINYQRTDGGNGHRRRQLTQRVKAEETNCALCGQRVDKTLKYAPGQHNRNCIDKGCKGCKPHPMRAEVDEIVPRAKGGTPLERSNLQLTHRECNNRKSDKPNSEATQSRTPPPRITAASDGW